MATTNLIEKTGLLNIKKVDVNCCNIIPTQLWLLKIVLFSILEDFCISFLHFILYF